MKKLHIVSAALLAILVAAGSVQASTIAWSGTASGYYHSNTSASFDPNGTGTTISGTLDITSLSDGAVEMFGLIDKKLMDSGGYMWQSGAYMYVYKKDGDVKIGTSDGNYYNEIVADGTWVGAVDEIDFSLTIFNQQITLTSSLFTGTKTRSYGVVKTLNNASGYAWDEFEEGAYLGGSLWSSGGSFDFDVTAADNSPSVPEPTTFLIWSVLGVLGLAFGYRR